jgi:hypothetical protein
MLSPRFLALPAIALAVIVALSQAHSGTPATDGVRQTVFRAVSCATEAAAPECTIAASRAAVIR